MIEEEHFYVFQYYLSLYITIFKHMISYVSANNKNIYYNTLILLTYLSIKIALLITQLLM